MHLNQTAVAALAASLVTASSFGAVTGLTGLFIQNAPTEDLTAPDFAGVPNGFIQPVFSAAPDVAQSEAIMTGFTTAFGSAASVAGPIAASGVETFPIGLAPPEGDVIRNVWGFQGPEVVGVDSILGTNVGAGLDNAGATGDPENPTTPFNVFFGTEIIGAPGQGNDFFLIDIIGDDAVDLQPIGLDGAVIGDFRLRLASGPGEGNFGNSDLGDFGLTGFDLSLFLENGANIGLDEETVIDDVPLAGVAFDIEDFVGTGELEALAGFRITPLDLDPTISSGNGSIDLISIGYNTAAVPAPGAWSLGALFAGGLAARRRRR